MNDLDFYIICYRRNNIMNTKIILKTLGLPQGSFIPNSNYHEV